MRHKPDVSKKITMVNYSENRDITSFQNFISSIQDRVAKIGNGVAIRNNNFATRNYEFLFSFNKKKRKENGARQAAGHRI